MEDLFKKFVNAGVGYIAQGSKSVQSTIEKLVKDNKMTQAEGKKIVDELMKSGETKRAELEKQFQGLADRVKTTVGLGDDKPKGKANSKKPAAKSAAATANGAASKAAGAVKKVADRVSAAADSAQRSAAAKSGAAKSAAKPAAKSTSKPAAKPAASKPAAKKPAAAPAAPAAKAEGNA